MCINTMRKVSKFIIDKLDQFSSVATPTINLLPSNYIPAFWYNTKYTTDIIFIYNIPPHEEHLYS